MREWLLLFLFYKWEIWVPGKWSDLLDVTSQRCDGIWTQPTCLKASEQKRGRLSLWRTRGGGFAEELFWVFCFKGRMGINSLAGKKYAGPRKQNLNRLKSFYSFIHLFIHSFLTWGHFFLLFWEREIERERNINVKHWSVAFSYAAWPGIEPTTWVCALTRNQTHAWAFGLQGNAPTN